MINFKNTKFIISLPSYKLGKDLIYDEVLFAGRSNVGKSSLLNALVEQRIAFVSSKPGHTKLLNYFEVDKKFYLVDAPGYGYTAKGNKYDVDFGKLMDEYLENPKLKLVLLLLDSRRIPNEDDIMLYNYLKDSNTFDYYLVMTKCDKLNQSEKAKIIKNLKESFGDVDASKVIYTSSKDKRSINLLQEKISNYIV